MDMNILSFLLTGLCNLKTRSLKSGDFEAPKPIINLNYEFIYRQIVYHQVDYQWLMCKKGIKGLWRRFSE